MKTERKALKSDSLSLKRKKNEYLCTNPVNKLNFTKLRKLLAKGSTNSLPTLY